VAHGGGVDVPDPREARLHPTVLLQGLQAVVEMGGGTRDGSEIIQEALDPAASLVSHWLHYS